MPVSFAIASALIQPDSRCRVTVSDAGVDRSIDGVVLQIDPSGVVVASDQGRLFFSLDVVKLIVPAATNETPPRLVNGSTAHVGLADHPAVDTREAPTEEAPQPDHRAPDSSTATGQSTTSTDSQSRADNGREAELLQQFARAPLVDLALPALSLPNHFEVPQEQREFERTTSRLAYALKIKEPHRIDEEIARLAAWVRSFNASSSFRIFLGDLAASRSKFEEAARQYESVADLPDGSLLSSSFAFAKVGQYSRAVTNLAKYLEGQDDVGEDLGLLLLQCCYRLGSLHPDLERLCHSATRGTVKQVVANAMAASTRKSDSPGNSSVGQSEPILKSPQQLPHPGSLVEAVDGGSAPISGIGVIQNYNSVAKRGLIYDGKQRVLLQFDSTAKLDDLILGALSAGSLGIRVRYAGLRQPNLATDGVVTSATFIDATKSAGHAESKAKENSGSGSRDTYNRAKQAERERKYDFAARLFLEEVRGRGRQAESAMKDLAMLHARRGDVEQAIQLLYDSEHLITNFRAYHNILAHTLLKAKRYDDAISEYEKVSALIPASNVAERNTVERNIALTYAQTKRFDQARAALQKILKQSPNDETTRNVLERLEDFAQALERDKRGSPDLLDRLKIGVSDFQYHFIRRCDFSVLDERARSRGYFVAQDFSDVDTEIKKIGNERKPKRRGEFFLTLAAMAAKADAIEDETQMHSYLANFFSNWAEYAINERFHRDAVRSLLTEAMLISSEYNHIDRCAKLYMISFSNEQLEANEFFGRTRHHPSRILQDTLMDTDSRRHCHRLLKYIAARNPSASNLAETVRRIEESLQGDCADGDYSSSAEDRRQIIRQQVRDSLPISQIALQQYLLTLQNCEPRLEFELDRKKTKRLASVVQTIIRLLDEQEYTDKEFYTRQVVAELGTIEAEINGDAFEKYEAGPTHWLVEGLLPNIDRLREGVQAHFEQFRKAASASVLVEDIRADGHYPVNESGAVDLDLVISLSGNSPIEALKLLARPSSNQTSQVAHVKGALRSQERREISIPIVLSPSERQSPVVSVEVIAQYEERASERKNQQKFTMPIRVGGSSFEPIKNRFSNGAGGVPVEEPEMFFGRDHLIKEMDETICDGAEGSSFVIYGQQRSGKSSILRQLKNKLSKRCFVVEISLGELRSQMELWQLTYLVRNKIEEELEDQRIKIETLPDLQDIRNDPLAAFSQTIRKTRKCLQASAPTRERIVLLIDEFSYINSSHIQESVRLDFMRFWKAMLQANLFSAVLAAQNDWPILRRRYSNQLAVSKEVQISFLDQDQAILLASKPILYQGRSRFLGASLDRVFAMSGGSPFYIQKICDELVKFLNARRDNFISDAHVDRIFEKVLREWELSDFHSQYAMRDVDTIEQSETKTYVKFLTMVAERTSDGPKTASAFGQDIATKEQLDEGLRRLELERDSTGKVAIKVGIFAEYLRRHADLTS